MLFLPCCCYHVVVTTLLYLQVTCDTTQTHFKVIFDCYTSMLTDSNTSLSFKVSSYHTCYKG